MSGDNMIEQQTTHLHFTLLWIHRLTALLDARQVKAIHSL